MTNKMLQSFLREVYHIATAACDKEFASKFNHIRRERERVLRNSWAIIPSEDKTPGMKQFVFKEIDFDTIVTHSLKYIKSSESYLNLLYQIAQVAIKYGQFDKASKLLTTIVSKKSSAEDNELIAKSYQKLAEVNFLTNDYEGSRENLNSSLKLYQALNNDLGVAQVKNSLSIVMIETGQPEKGKELLLEAQEYLSNYLDDDLMHKIFVNLGIVCHRLGELNESMTYYKKALDLLKENDEQRKARILHNIAVVYKSQGEYGKASAYLMKSLNISKKINNVYQKGLSYLEQAEVTLKMGDLAESTALATTTFQIFSELGAKLHIAEVYKIFGMINRKSQKYDVALSYLENSKRINKENDNKLNLGETYYEMGKYFQELGKSRESVINYKSALEQFKLIQANAKIRQVEDALKAC